MPLYVLALTDAPLEPRTVGRRTLQAIDLGGVHALCERRTVPPPATDDELREQHALVVDAASRVPAILPVRFGALIGKRALVALVRAHHAEIRQGLDEVRGRVQMTVRVAGARAPVSTVRASSGIEYLERRRRAATPVLPRAARALLSLLAPVVVRERTEPGAGRLLATVYHLVESGRVAHYSRIVAQAGNAAGTAIVTGPWPPFAFTPQLF